ncbi:MAG TPA: ABC transporter permease [Polyangiaceae bacterium]|nr:ABC transporter permease [Polyangiaceae bacterium]
MNELALFLSASLASGTPLALAALGLLLNERAGVINLGTEGLMLVAAVTGFATTVHSHHPALGLLAGAAASALLSALLGALVIFLDTNQYATGLALSLFGAGFSAFVGVPYTQESIPAHASTGIPVLAHVPFIGPALFSHHPLVYGAMILAAAETWFFFRSKPGLVVRAIGEAPEAAQALGYRVRSIRFKTVVLGGALVGLAGAYVSVVATPLWVEGMIAGKGWIALALTTFATWRPMRVLLGAYLFGAVTMLQLHLQGRGISLPVEFLTALPYLSTILVLVVISRNPRFIAANIPASLGKPFHSGA